MPARFWKWRMRGAALFFAGKIAISERYDGIIATDLLNLADLKALLQPNCPPMLAYFHENQLSYPLAPGEHTDFQFGFTNITTALAAERVIFNSRTHFDSFLSRLPDFLNMMPDYPPKWIIREIRSKSGVLYPGCRFPIRRKPLSKLPFEDGRPLIIWNHRWEFDKNPRPFFEALGRIDESGLDFRVALLGENYKKVPKEFIAARKRFSHRIAHYGYEPSKEQYFEWLKRGTIVISTSIQENFGISTIEAIRHGCLPLLPDRLSYPEIIPSEFHTDFLYRDQEDLISKLKRIMINLSDYIGKRDALSEAMGRFSWEIMAEQYDRELEKIVRQG